MHSSLQTPTIDNIKYFKPEHFIKPIIGAWGNFTHQAVIKLPCGKESSVHRNTENFLLTFESAIEIWTARAISLCCSSCQKKEECFKSFFILAPS